VLADRLFDQRGVRVDGQQKRGADDQCVGDRFCGHGRVEKENPSHINPAPAAFAALPPRIADLSASDTSSCVDAREHFLQAADLVRVVAAGQDVVGARRTRWPAAARGRQS